MNCCTLRQDSLATPCKTRIEEAPPGRRAAKQRPPESLHLRIGNRANVSEPVSLLPSYQRQPLDRRRRIPLHHLAPQRELRLRRHEPPEATTGLAPQPRLPDRVIAIATAVHTTLRHAEQQPVRGRPMKADRLKSSGTLIRAHSLNRAGPGGHWLTCSLQRFGDHRDLQQAHRMSPHECRHQAMAHPSRERDDQSARRGANARFPLRSSPPAEPDSEDGFAVELA